jgi:hypothetical protein
MTFTKVQIPSCIKMKPSAHCWWNMHLTCSAEWWPSCARSGGVHLKEMAWVGSAFSGWIMDLNEELLEGAVFTHLGLASVGRHNTVCIQVRIGWSLYKYGKGLHISLSI